MGYHQMTVKKLYEIFRRWHHKQMISHISFLEGFTRKTITNYIKKFEDSGYSPQIPIQDQDHESLMKYLKSLLSKNIKSAPLLEQLEQYLDEIKDMLTDQKEPVKLKTAWKIIVSKYKWEGGLPPKMWTQS